MENFEIVNIVCYILLAIFVMAQTIQLKAFKASGEQFHPQYKRLSVAVPIGTLFEFGYSFYYGFETIWWAGALLLFVAYIISILLNLFLEKVSRGLPTLVSVLGFIGIPVLIYFCIVTTP